MVRAHSGPPFSESQSENGGLAQLGERLICIQEVSGSIPLFSTTDESRRCTLKTEQRRKKSKATEGVALKDATTNNSIVELLIRNRSKDQFR